LADARFSESRPPRLPAAAAAACIAFLAIGMPWVLDAAQRRLGTRGLALLLLGGVALTLVLRGPAADARRVAAAGLAGLLALGVATGDVRFLRLVPAGVYLGLALLFAASLRGPGSLIEAAARWLVPEAPDFIRGYCRGVTLLWVCFFLASAVVIGWLAVAGSAAAWLAASSREVWLAMGALTALEFLFRKTWFRYYFRGGPFERLWSRLFPAERTARGRRSLAAIEAHRARVARGAPDASSD
jgi:uncharacterized membrane protein